MEGTAEEEEVVALEEEVAAACAGATVLRICGARSEEASRRCALRHGRRPLKESRLNSDRLGLLLLLRRRQRLRLRLRRRWLGLGLRLRLQLRLRLRWLQLRLRLRLWLGLLRLWRRPCSVAVSFAPGRVFAAATRAYVSSSSSSCCVAAMELRLVLGLWRLWRRPCSVAASFAPGRVFAAAVLATRAYVSSSSSSCRVAALELRLVQLRCSCDCQAAARPGAVVQLRCFEDGIARGTRAGARPSARGAKWRTHEVWQRRSGLSGAWSGLWAPSPRNIWIHGFGLSTSRHPWTSASDHHSGWSDLCRKRSA